MRLQEFQDQALFSLGFSNCNPCGAEEEVTYQGSGQHGFNALPLERSQYPVRELARMRVRLCFFSMCFLDSSCAALSRSNMHPVADAALT